MLGPEIGEQPGDGLILLALGQRKKRLDRLRFRRRIAGCQCAKAFEQCRAEFRSERERRVAKKADVTQLRGLVCRQLPGKVGIRREVDRRIEHGFCLSGLPATTSAWANVSGV